MSAPRRSSAKPRSKSVSNVATGLAAPRTAPKTPTVGARVKVPRAARAPGRLASSKPELPPRAIEGIAKAQAAVRSLQNLQRRSNWAPRFAQRLAQDFQEARAMLSKAEATLAAWRGGIPWATPDELVRAYQRFVSFVQGLEERGGFREKRAKSSRRTLARRSPRT